MAERRGTGLFFPFFFSQLRRGQALSDRTRKGCFIRNDEALSASIPSVHGRCWASKARTLWPARGVILPVTVQYVHSRRFAALCDRRSERREPIRAGPFAPCRFRKHVDILVVPETPAAVGLQQLSALSKGMCTSVCASRLPSKLPLARWRDLVVDNVHAWGPSGRSAAAGCLCVEGE